MQLICRGCVAHWPVSRVTTRGLLGAISAVVADLRTGRYLASDAFVQVGLVLTDVSLAYAQMDLRSQSSFVMFDDYYTCGFIMRPHQSITNSSTLSLLVVCCWVVNTRGPLRHGGSRYVRNCDAHMICRMHIVHAHEDCARWVEGDREFTARERGGRSTFKK